MTEWQPRSLADLARLQKGRKVYTTPSTRNGFVPYLGASALEGGLTKYADPTNAVTATTSDVLMLWDGERSGLVGRGQDGAVGSTVVKLTPRGRTDAGFLFHALNRKFDWIQARRTGTGIPHVPKDLASYLRLPVPPRSEEQVLIAEILDTVDEEIRSTEKLIAKLERMTHGLLHDLFARGIDDNGGLRNPERHPKEFKDSPVGPIPLGWDVQPLEHWVRPDAPITYGIVQAGPNIPSGVPYIRTGDMAGDRLSLRGLLRTSRSIAKAYKRSEVRSGEIVCAIRATVGKVLPVPQELDGANLTQGTARISPGVSVHGGFLLWAIRGRATQRQIARQKKGTTFQEITLRQLRQLLVAIPTSKDEQSFIARLMERCEARQRTESTYLAKLQALRKGISDDLLTGRVRVTELLEGDGA